MKGGIKIVNQLILLFGIIIFSFIIAFTNEIIRLKVYRKKNKNHLIYNIYIKTLTGIAMAYTTYLINSKLIVVGSILGALIGSPMIEYILKKIGVDTSNVSIENCNLELKQGSEVDSQLTLLDMDEDEELIACNKLLYLMQLLNMITYEESQKIILKQYSDKQQFYFGKVNKLKRIKEIYLESQKDKEKVKAEKYIEIILQLQKDKDFIRALNEKRKVDSDISIEGNEKVYD